MIAVRRSIVASSLDIGVVELGEWASGAFSAYILCLDCGFILDRINSNDSIFLMEILNRNSIIINRDGEVVSFHNVNSKVDYTCRCELAHWRLGSLGYIG